jgi:hypothetical protein
LFASKVSIGTSTNANALNVGGTVLSTALSIQGVSSVNAFSFANTGGAAGIHTDGSNLYIGANGSNIYFRPLSRTSGAVQPYINSSGSFNDLASINVSSTTLTSTVASRLSVTGTSTLATTTISTSSISDLNVLTSLYAALGNF